MEKRDGCKCRSAKELWQTPRRLTVTESVQETHERFIPDFNTVSGSKSAMAQNVPSPSSVIVAGDP